ncbi:MAG: hypothetical protein H3Z52_13020 [archaeon]|nr:hypothetical protein [archaeon]
MRSVSVEEKLSKTESYLEEAVQMYFNKKYSDAYVKALVAWAWGSRTYQEVMMLIDDSGRTSLFFFSLIIPVAILFERLLVHAQGKRQLIWVLLVGTLLLALFGFVHPALTLMANANLAILGLISIALFAITTGILADETQKMMKELSYRILGYHTVETGRLGLVTTTFSVAIENMRRRKFRTLLVLVNLITIAFAFASLTSISSYIGIKFVPWRGYAPYSGIFIKSHFSVPPNDLLGIYTADLIRGVVGEDAEILPRSWYYPPSIGPNVGVVTGLTAEKDAERKLTYPINAMLGLTPKDMKNTFADYSETPILDVTEGYYCLIPDTAAKVLRVNLGDYVICQGIRFRVTGILDTEIMPIEIKDLSDMNISPINPYYVNPLSIEATLPLTPGEIPRSLSWEEFIIVPYHVALDLGGYVAEISVRFPSSIRNEDLINLSRDLAQVLDLPVYVGVGGKIWATSRFSTFSALGLEGIIIILSLGSLNVVATLFSIQKERTRDMYVYTTVGLSPRGAITMCILESIIYSLLGIIIGYFAGFIGNIIFVGVGMLPTGFTFNYASSFIVLSLAILLLAAIASSTYPAYLTSKLITPSLERKWKPPTKPKKGVWEIPLPMKIPEVDEVRGFIVFLKEYYLGAGVEKAHFHTTKVNTVSMSSMEPKLYLEIALAPFEAGVMSSVTINTLWNETEKKYDFSIVLQKTLGDETLWAKGSYFFIDDFRTQILMWRFIKVEDRNKYMALARKEA